VAQKLHDQYGFNYDNLKVLLGGWTSWQGAGYPTEGTGAAAPPVVISTPASP
jgi:3-mercaptopyruvate sulfurtransferase SseA